MSPVCRRCRNPPGGRSRNPSGGSGVCLVDGGSLVGQGATDGVGLADDGGFDVGDAVALAAEPGEVDEGVGVGVFEPVDDELEDPEGVGGVVEVEGDGGVVGHWSVSGVGRCRGR